MPTGSSASLRATEIGSEVILKATRVDGVYDDDPLKNPNAKLFKSLEYLDVLKKSLRVMDSTAISLCMDNNLPILVFNLTNPGNFKRVVLGDDIGTIVRRGE